MVAVGRSGAQRINGPMKVIGAGSAAVALGYVAVLGRGVGGRSTGAEMVVDVLLVAGYGVTAVAWWTWSERIAPATWARAGLARPFRLLGASQVASALSLVVLAWQYQQVGAGAAVAGRVLAAVGALVSAAGFAWWSRTAGSPAAVEEAGSSPRSTSPGRPDGGRTKRQSRVGPNAPMRSIGAGMVIASVAPAIIFLWSLTRQLSASVRVSYLLVPIGYALASAGWRSWADVIPEEAWSDPALRRPFGLFAVAFGVLSGASLVAVYKAGHEQQGALVAAGELLLLGGLALAAWGFYRWQEMTSPELSVARQTRRAIRTVVATVRVSCSPEEAFEYLADPLRHPEWSPKPLSIEQAHGSHGEGQSFVSQGFVPNPAGRPGEDQVRNRVAVTVSQRPTLFVTISHDDHGNEFVGRISVEPIDGGTVVTRTVDLPRPWADLPVSGPGVVPPTIRAHFVAEQLAAGLKLLKNRLDGQAGAGGDANLVH